MKVVYNKNNTKLQQKTKNKWIFSVEWEGENRKFWLNFPFQLLKIVEQKKEGDIIKKFTIKADTITSLKDLLKKYKNKLPYDLCMELLYNIGNQLQTLERFYLGVPYIDLDDIVVVNEKTFLFLNSGKIIDIKSQELEINEPMKKSAFFSPELIKISKIPAAISFKSSFYSLGSLIVFCFYNKFLNNSIDIKSQIKSLTNTKLYWALQRLLQEQPSNRFYFII
jgi:hypothetical protein